jgi:hypothetical protein
MVVADGMKPQEHADIARALRRHDVQGSVAAVEDTSPTPTGDIHMSTQLHVDAGAQRVAG